MRVWDKSTRFSACATGTAYKSTCGHELPRVVERYLLAANLYDWTVVHSANVHMLAANAKEVTVAVHDRLFSKGALQELYEIGGWFYKGNYIHESK